MCFVVTLAFAFFNFFFLLRDIEFQAKSNRPKGENRCFFCDASELEKPTLTSFSQAQEGCTSLTKLPMRERAPATPITGALLTDDGLEYVFLAAETMLFLILKPFFVFLMV